MPPKPKELDKANFTSLFFAFRGTKSNPNAEGLGLIKFRVGGTISLTTDKIENIASTAPAAQSK